MIPFKHLPADKKFVVTVSELNYFANMMIGLIEGAENIVDGGPVTRQAEKLWNAWAKQIETKNADSKGEPK